MSYEQAMGTNGKGGSASNQPATELTDGGPTVAPEETRAQVHEMLDGVGMMIRRAETGTEEERFAGRQRLREWLSHHDTIEERRAFQQGTVEGISEELRQRMINTYASAERVSQGLPAVAGATRGDPGPNYLLWGGIGAGVLLIVGVAAYALR